MDNYFSKLSDKDFYSDKLTHIYFNSRVEDKSIDELISKIKTATKPILIHICSFGGNLTDGVRLLTVFKMSKVPIATIIDNYSCSAATFLSISSPYRVMNKYSFCLLHEYSVSGYINKRRDYFVNSLKEIDRYFNIIIDMYLEKTKYSKQELLDLLQHNIFLDYKTCLSKGIVDRVIDVNYSSSLNNEKINIYDLLKSSNINNLSISCDFNYSNIDLSIMTSNASPNKNPYLIYPNHEDCEKSEKDKEIMDIKNNDVLTEKNIFKTLNIISRINIINSLKIGIIDTPISIDNLIPLLFTDKIYMYKHAFIVCNLIYLYNMNNSILLDDNMKNTKLLMNVVKSIFKKKTKMKQLDISNINKKFIIVNSKQALEWGLCHEIIE